MHMREYFRWERQLGPDVVRGADQEVSGSTNVKATGIRWKVPHRYWVLIAGALPVQVSP